MKEIGEFLKQKRLEKGITIDQIAEKTRMPAVRIKAIEEGNLDAFKDDLSYLQFFIQSYCNAIGIDYHEVKSQLSDSINSYTMSFQADQLRAQSESEKNIREKSTQRVNEYKKRNPAKKVERKIDFSLISFVAVIALVIICLATVGGYYLTRQFAPGNDEPIADVTPPEDDTTDDKPQADQPEEPVEVKEIEAVAAEQVGDYVIENAEDKFILRIEFASNSWFRAILDGTELSTPEARVYDAGTTLEIELDPASNTDLNLRFGYFAGTKMFVDDQEVVIDESIANSTGVQEINFTIGGNTSEPAE